MDRCPRTRQTPRDAEIEVALHKVQDAVELGRVDSQALGQILARSEDGTQSFAARCQGAWRYVAWEPPNSKCPNGRLWLSDTGGVRGFEP